jgi:hypothetical protein
MAFVCVIRYFSHDQTVIVPSHDTWSEANKSRLKLKLSARCGTGTHTHGIIQTTEFEPQGL